MVRLQAEMGPRGVRRRQDAPRPVREHLAARYRPLQQVSLLNQFPFTLAQDLSL